jgi:hypothetical protein
LTPPTARSTIVAVRASVCVSLEEHPSETVLAPPLLSVTVLTSETFACVVVKEPVVGTCCSTTLVLA